jgi:hypothetical protein
MQVGPMRSDLQPSGFGGDQGVFVGLRLSVSRRRLAPPDHFRTRILHIRLSAVDA